MSSAIPKLVTVILLSCLPIGVLAQVSGGARASKVDEGLGKTWKGPSSTVISRLFVSRASTSTTVRKSTAARPAVRKPANVVPKDPIVFHPVSDSGVAQSLIDALASNATERQGLAELFSQVKKSYEAEVAKDGKSNNLAEALTFFVASSVVAYNDSPEPSDAALENFYNSLSDTMRNTPEFTRMSNTEKQQMHDWLVLMGGFILATHIDAKQSGNAESLQNSRQLAYYAFRILGIDPTTLTFAGSGTASFRHDYLWLNISTSSPIFNRPPAFSAIRFWPSKTLPLKLR